MGGASESMTTTSESEILRSVHARLGALPHVRIWRQQVGGGVTFSGHKIRWGLPGMADLAGVVTVHGIGVALFVEVKSEKGRQRKEQVAFQATMERFGAIYLLVRSAEEAEVLLADRVREFEYRIRGA